MDHKRLQSNVQKLYAIVHEFEVMFPNRPFTPDGYMVGSLGECLVADAYELELMPPSNKGFDALDASGKRIEIKATQGKTVGFRSCPDHAIIIKINKNGSFDEYFNGPGGLIWAQFAGRKLPSNGQFQISLSKVAKLNAEVPDAERVRRVA